MRSQGGHISQVKGEFEPSVFFFLPNLSFVTLARVQKCDLFGPLAIATIITTLQDQFSRQKVKLLQLNFHDLLLNWVLEFLSLKKPINQNVQFSHI